MVNPGVGVMAATVLVLLPAEVLLPVSLAAVLSWHVFRVGGFLRCSAFRAPFIPTVTLMSLPKLWASWTAQRTKPGRPQIVEVLTDDNNGTVALHNALVVVSACIRGGRFDDEVVHASLQNKQRYCDLYDITLPSCVRCALFDRRTPGEHHAKWEKYLRLHAEMAASRDEWFMWIDCDAVFTNVSFDWSRLLPQRGRDTGARPSRDLVVSRDRNGFNLGVFFLRNTPWSLGYIDAMLAKQDHIDDQLWRRRRPNSLRDQRALDEMLLHDPLLIRRLQVVPQKLINSFLSHKKGNGATWGQGDWIAHQVDCLRAECNAELLDVAGRLV